MDENNLLIELENISFSYPSYAPVLDNLNFKLHENERIGLMGPNGSGKTTLFHIIMGLLKPDSGKISIFGNMLKNEKDFTPIRQQIGLLFQDADDQLFSPTVLEDVTFGPLNQGKSVKEACEIGRDVLGLLGLEKFEDRITYKLSGGEKKLVSLATVLAMKPKILLLDEPTNGLDYRTTQKIITIIEDIDIAYIFISHNIDFISRTTDKIYGLVNGKLYTEDDKIPHSHVHSHDYGRIPHTHSHEDS